MIYLIFYRCVWVDFEVPCSQIFRQLHLMFHEISVNQPDFWTICFAMFRWKWCWNTVVSSTSAVLGTVQRFSSKGVSRCLPRMVMSWRGETDDNPLGLECLERYHHVHLPSPLIPFQSFVHWPMHEATALRFRGRPSWCKKMCHFLSNASSISTSPTSTA